MAQETEPKAAVEPGGIGSVGRIVKKVIRTAGLLLCIAAIFMVYRITSDWTIRFKPELDRFFGEGNWECIDSEGEVTRSSIVRNHSEKSVSYRVWEIRYWDSEGNERSCIISNLPYRINKKDHLIFSSKRFSKKEALIQELEETAEVLAVERLFEDVVPEDLSEKQVASIDISLWYNERPSPKYFSELWKHPWFTAETVTVEDYLLNDLGYVEIREDTISSEKLTEEEYQQLLDRVPEIKQNMLDKFGEHADFTIYFGDIYNVEYEDGQKLEGDYYYEPDDSE